jgi:ArsR family transcriptional regulator, virulence genes transcriptional regulator
MDAMTMEDMREKAPLAAAFLKGLASPQRLAILCRLAPGEACVTDLIAATGIAPTSMSQHLARLKEEGIVAVRRDHRTLFYRIDHPATLAVMTVLHDHFCKDKP